eukprot:Gb_34636 [translate_table: standard]
MLERAIYIHGECRVNCIKEYCKVIFTTSNPLSLWLWTSHISNFNGWIATNPSYRRPAIMTAKLLPFLQAALPSQQSPNSLDEDGMHLDAAVCTSKTIFVQRLYSPAVLTVWAFNGNYAMCRPSVTYLCTGEVEAASMIWLAFYPSQIMLQLQPFMQALQIQYLFKT